jgi:16S rRNA C1402 (ribose-2'-O) methylase RsmI
MSNSTNNINGEINGRQTENNYFHGFRGEEIREERERREEIFEKEREEVKFIFFENISYIDDRGWVV